MKLLKENWILALVIIEAAILRLYQLSPYLQFLGDEGRDALIVKRMIVDHQFTLLGPTASVGGFYIGPIYYYFMLPFLWVAKLDPVGPAVMSALFGIAMVGLTYLFCKQLWNKQTALLAAFFVALSPYMVYTSRFSWNPNPVPLFSLLAIYFLYLASKKGKLIYTFLTGISVGVILQLHYMGLIILPIIAIASLLIIPGRRLLFHFLVGALGTILGSSLFLLFEIRHDFTNIRSAWEFITRSSEPVGPRSANPVVLFDDVLRRLYEIDFKMKGTAIRFLYYLSFVPFTFFLIKKFTTGKRKVIILTTWLLLSVFGVGFYRGQLLPHYFGVIIPLPFIILASAVTLFWKNRLWKLAGILTVFSLTALMIAGMYFWSPPNNLVEQTKSIDRAVLDLAGNEPFNFALITPGNSDHAYRYFLEIWGRSPLTIESPAIDPKRTSITNQLIVVCEDPDCKPLGHPLWEVAGFGRAEIVAQKIGPIGIKVYKLIHYTGR